MVKKLISIIFILASILTVLLFMKSDRTMPIENNKLEKSVVDSPLNENQMNSTKTNENYVDEMLSKMTLDEKIGQMFFVGISGTELDENSYKLIQQDQVGGVIFFRDNLTTPNQITTLLNEIKSANEDNPLPLFLGIDEEGGVISRLPKVIVSLPSSGQIGQTQNVSFAYDVGTILGKQLSSFGFNLNFAPVLDVNSNPNNPVIGVRSFGNNAELVSDLGIQVMRGLQSQNIIPVIKHFPGHGDTSVDSHLELPRVSKTMQQLENLELIPFKQAIKDGADVVMIAHILLPTIDEAFPASMSKKVVTDLLRNRLRFNGVIITDDMTMKAIANNYTIPQATVETVSAGSDIVLIAHDYNEMQSSIKSLKTAVMNGVISEERINTSVKRILILKNKYKLNNNKTQNVNVDTLNQSANNVLQKYN